MEESAPGGGMTHVMFCCNQHCRDAKIMDMRRNIGSVVDKTNHTLTDPDGRVFKFITGKTIDRHQVDGLLFDSWSTCGNVDYDKQMKAYLDSRIGRG